MGLLFRRHEGREVLTQMGVLSLTLFFFSLAGAFTSTIWAVYLDQFFDSEALVGLVSGGFILLAILSYFVMIPIVERSNKRKLLLYSLFAIFVAYILFSIIGNNLILLILLAAVAAVFGTLRVTSFGIIMKDKSRKDLLSRNEGLTYTFGNIAYVIGPLIAGFLLLNMGVEHIFLFAGLFVFISFWIFKISNIKDANIDRSVDKNLVKNLKAFFKNKNYLGIYLIRFGMPFWWSLIYIFMPLFIIRNGLGVEWVGYFLFAVAIPLILTEYKFAKFAGENGFKGMFKLGYLIVSIAVISCFFVQSVYVIMSLLVVASFGMAMLEPTTVSYFLDLLKKKDENRFFGPFSTSDSLGALFGRIAPAIVLIFLPFKYIFLFFGIVMIKMFFICFTIKEVVEKRRKG
tara:strand:+ start:1291 stop:2493 length:1203 start_codon:yes stop_codon:yes gene_type:complete